ncbi:MAG: hypothetical protein ACOX9R_02625 [Armatimonadota bacterium]|jgi:type II secretory pathway pseudopilin PulG
MMRRLFGLLVGLLLFFPGAQILRWLIVDELGIYQQMTLTDALLAIIIILAGMLLFGQPRRPLTAEELESQAEKMELASRRLEQAQRQHAQAVRTSRLSRRSPSRPASASASGSGSGWGSGSGSRRSPRSTSAAPPSRSSRGARSDRRSRR